MIMIFADLDGYDSSGDESPEERVEPMPPPEPPVKRKRSGWSDTTKRDAVIYCVQGLKHMSSR